MAGEKIGFIGLGAMGVGMSKNLLDAGYAVCGFDVSTEPMAALVDAGGTAGTSPAMVAASTSLLIVCVFSADQAEEVLFGIDGAAETLPKGGTVVMCTTMAPEHSRDIAARLEKNGHQFIDAPITGGKRGADQGTLTVIASGSDEAMAAADGAFKAMGGRVCHVGDAPGAGSTVKMINQLLVGVHVVAAAEAMALATKAGADPQTVYDVITHGGGNSVVFESRVPYMLTEDYAPRGVVDIFIKDLGIVADAARSLPFPLPMATAALQQFLSASASGYGRSDDASVVKVYEQIAGTNVAAAAKLKH